MSWLTVRYHPGFADDLTSWTTTIERKGKLVQRVDSWPDGRTIEHRARLSDACVIELERIIAAIDFEELADRGKRGAVVDDTASVGVLVKHAGSVSSFDAPLTYWAWARAKGHQSNLPLFDFEPALRLWEAVNRCSPHKL